MAPFDIIGRETGRSEDMIPVSKVLYLRGRMSAGVLMRVTSNTATTGNMCWSARTYDNLGTNYKRVLAIPRDWSANTV